jgi:hypothetical protein
MQPMPKRQEFEREFAFPYIPPRWIIWDPIPDWLDLRPEILQKIFVITLDIQKEHLAVEQRKIDMVKELFQ